MSISLKTHKMLWGRSGNKCAICKTDLVEDITETDDYSIVGEEAHIVAREKKGPRGNSPLEKTKRDLYSNLILLCQKHHKIIDDHELEYPVEKLHEIRQNHLDWVKQSLGQAGLAKQKDDEDYATIIEKVAELANFDRWNGWSGYILSNGQPQINQKIFQNLEELNLFILSRIWPKRYTNLELALNNLRYILNDFIKVFSKYSQARGNDYFYTRKFYQASDDFQPNIYDKQLAKYNYHVDLVQDLMYEMTRAMNYLIRQIRCYISPSFRSAEGVLMVTTGPGMDLKWSTVRLEYETSDAESEMYKGLNDFMSARAGKEHFGTGVSKDYI